MYHPRNPRNKSNDLCKLTPILHHWYFSNKTTSHSYNLKQAMYHWYKSMQTQYHWDKFSQILRHWYNSKLMLSLMQFHTKLYHWYCFTQILYNALGRSFIIDKLLLSIFCIKLTLSQNDPKQRGPHGEKGTIRVTIKLASTLSCLQACVHAAQLPISDLVIKVLARAPSLGSTSLDPRERATDWGFRY